jgi:FlaA1/EpsC-like NDP-sugar epimerase
MRRFTFSPLQNRSTAILAVVYAGILSASFFLAYEVRFDFVVAESFQQERLKYLFLASGALFSIWLATGGAYAPPRGIILIDYILALAGLSGVRIVLRMYRERVSAVKKGPETPAQRIGIMGAGDVGASLSREFLNMPSRGLRPVVFFDDNPSKHGQLVHGVPVLGPPELIATAKGEYRIDKVVIAMPSASNRRIQEVIRLVNAAGLKVEIVPSFEDLTKGRVRVTRLRPVEVEDLLGRDPVNLDSEAIRRLIEDRVVLVTGAGGSIGGELCRQIADCHPRRLLMVEQCEGSLFQIEQELIERGLGAKALPLVADILDRGRMEGIFARYQPAIVFHAAAHKHVYMMERQPGEAVKNNATGTRQLAATASRHQTKIFVFISTDKAINPTSVMGATKRLAEIHLQAAQQRPGNQTRFMAVRFGNVLGSSGSVIPIFRRQIANGGPVTVTHPEIVRFFMTIPEAAGLVLQSMALGQGGEIFVLDMGSPVKILDLAHQMIELSGLKPGEDIEIRIIGLKPGEKLFEEVQHRSEDVEVTTHPRVMRLKVNHRIEGLSENAVRELEEPIDTLEGIEIKQLLKKVVTEYSPYLE